MTGDPALELLMGVLSVDWSLRLAAAVDALPMFLKMDHAVVFLGLIEVENSS